MLLLTNLLAATSTKTSTGFSPVSLLLPVLLIFVFYFLLIRPQRRQAQRQKDLLGSIEVGDEVLTTSGMYGIVREMDEDTVVVEISEGVDVRFVKAAISRKVLAESEPAESEPADPEDAAEAGGGG